MAPWMTVGTFSENDNHFIHNFSRVTMIKENKKKYLNS